jgi:transketolase C-terminal domain/subunit
VIISSGRGVHEALAAASEIAVTVVDMPTIDESLLLELYDSGKPLFFAEQNNGYIWQSFLKVMYRRRGVADFGRVFRINTLDAEGRPQFIHSGTLEELTEAFGLTGRQIAAAIRKQVRA